MSYIDESEQEAGPATRRALAQLQRELRDLQARLTQAINASTGQLAIDHSGLENLNFSDSGHTGFASSSSVTAHAAATSGIHGVTGDVVGTTDTQTLTNKTISAASNTITLGTSDVGFGRDSSLPSAPSYPTLFWLNRQGSTLGDILYASIQLSTASWDWLEIGRRNAE